jgi:hypothetical protein
MRRAVSWTLPVLLVAALLLPSAIALPHTEHRTYVGGVGLVSLPLCGGTGSTSLLGVCFALLDTDVAVQLVIREDVQVGSVMGTAYFVDAAGSTVGASTVFCNQSPLLSIPYGAVALRVTLGPLPNVPALPGCLPGVAKTGVVTAYFL